MLYTLGLVGSCLAWLLPGHYYPYTAFHQDYLSAASCVLVALAAVITGRQWPVQMPSSAGVALLLIVVPAAQWAFGMLPFASDAWLSAMYLGGFVLAVVTGAQLSSSQPRFVATLFGAIAVAAVVSVGIGLVQWFGLGPYPFVEPAIPGDRLTANLAQPNQLASLLGIGIAAMIWLFESRKIGGLATSAAMVLLGAGLVLTQSRASWLFVGGFVALWVLYRRRLALRTRAPAVICAVGLFVLGMFLRAPLEALLQNADTAGVAMQVRGFEGGKRLINWQTLVDALMQSPWLGYGWLQIAAAQQAAALNHPSSFELLSAAHNQLLDFLVWNGVPLGLLLIGGMAWWTIDRMRRCGDLDTWGALLALAVLTAHSMVELPLQYAYFLLPAGLLVGVIEARTPGGGRFFVPVGKTVFACALLVMSGLLWVIWDEYLKVDEAVRQVRLKYETRIVHRDLNPRAPDVMLLDGQREYVKLWLDEPRVGMPAAELDWLRTVARRYPAPGAMMRYALAAGMNGRNEEAQRSLQLMCRMAVRRHCDQGRATWAAQAETAPQLRAIAYPPTPPGN